MEVVRKPFFPGKHIVKPGWVKEWAYEDEEKIVSPFGIRTRGVALRTSAHWWRSQSAKAGSPDAGPALVARVPFDEMHLKLIWDGTRIVCVSEQINVASLYPRSS